MIANGKPYTGEINLTRNSRRAILHLFVKDPRSHSIDRGPDRNRRLFVLVRIERVDDTSNTRLGWAILVVQDCVAKAIHDMSGDVRAEVLTSQDQLTNAGTAEIPITNQRQMRWSQLDNIDPVVIDHIEDCKFSVFHPRWVDDDSPTTHQWQEDRRERQVKLDR